MVAKDFNNKSRLSSVYDQLVAESENLTLESDNECESTEKLILNRKIWWVDNRATWIAHCIALCGDVTIKEAIMKLQSSILSPHKSCCGENPWMRGLEYLKNDYDL